VEIGGNRGRKGKGHREKQQGRRGRGGQRQRGKKPKDRHLGKVKHKNLRRYTYEDESASGGKKARRENRRSAALQHLAQKEKCRGKRNIRPEKGTVGSPKTVKKG